jgi:hypothetical protein
MRKWRWECISLRSQPFLVPGRGKIRTCDLRVMRPGLIPPNTNRYKSYRTELYTYETLKTRATRCCVSFHVLTQPSATIKARVFLHISSVTNEHPFFGMSTPGHRYRDSEDLFFAGEGREEPIKKQKLEARFYSALA